MPAYTPAEPHADGRAALVLVLGLLTALAPLTIDMYLPALPTIESELATGPAGGELTLSAYFVGMAVSQSAWGPLGDRLGRKAPMVAGLALYTLASVAAAAAPTLPALVAARFLQAAGGAAALVLVRAVVRDVWDTHEAARVLSQLMLIMGIAPILGPAAGSAVLTLTGWRGIFGVLAVAGAAAAALAALAVPDSGTRPPTGDPLRRRLASVVADPVFTRHALASAASLGALFAYISGSADALMGGLGLGPTAYAWLFGVNAAGIIGAAQVNRALLRRYALADVTLAAAAAVALGGAALVGVALRGAPAAVGVSVLFATVSGLGVTMSNLVALSLHRQGARAGLASGLLGTLQYAVSAVIAAGVGLLAAPAAALAAPTPTAGMTGMALTLALAATLALVATLAGRRALAHAG